MTMLAKDYRVGKLLFIHLKTAPLRQKKILLQATLTFMVPPAGKPIFAGLWRNDSQCVTVVRKQ
jgi:hypothetical protein